MAISKYIVECNNFALTQAINNLSNIPWQFHHTRCNKANHFALVSDDTTGSINMYPYVLYLMNIFKNLTNSL